MKMPKLGYTTIVVKESVRGMLEEIAKTQGYRSINQLFEAWIRGIPRGKPHRHKRRDQTPRNKP